MIAYVTSIGEKTTQICIDQLQRYGFTVVSLSDDEPWLDKYKEFIRLAAKSGLPCIRVDADVVPNENIREAAHVKLTGRNVMCQFKVYGLYRNGFIPSVVYYSPEAIKEIADDIDELDPRRPETSASRLKHLKGRLQESDLVVGMASFFQDYKHFNRSLRHAIDRGTVDKKDYDLAAKLLSL